jgi:phosphodiesterase/alkaline phosphatase D-like protein
MDDVEMEMDRREFLILGGGMAASVALAALTNPVQAQAALPNRVAAGDVTQTTAVLWARAGTTGDLIFEFGRDPDWSDAQSRTVNVSEVEFPASIVISNLLPGTRYYYRATDAAGSRSSGSFRTAQPTNAMAPAYYGFRMGVSGDWRGELAPYSAIANVDAAALDVFVLHGDTIYADYASPALEKPQAETLAEYRLKHFEGYGERFGRNSWGPIRSGTAILATIDDHEVTNDFSGGAPRESDPRFAAQSGALISDTAWFNNGLQAFQEYNPLRNETYGATGEARTSNRRKLYRYRSFGNDAAVFVLDCRSFRDAPIPPATDLDLKSALAFISASFQAGRTFLGRPQLEELKSDLLTAQQNRITWKFILVPEPIQNLGPLNGQDRFEGYAHERSELLQFIKENAIKNVVFVAADIHGTLVNNISYQEEAFGPQIESGAFEVTTGPVAFDAPFGPTLIDLAVENGLLSAEQAALINALPRAQQNEAIKSIVNDALADLELDYPPLGLENSPIPATLIRGTYVAVFTYGWTEFRVDAATQQLRVITYGIEPYTRAEMEADPAAIQARVPDVVSEFTVDAQPVGGPRVLLPIVSSPAG